MNVPDPPQKRKMYGKEKAGFPLLDVSDAVTGVQAFLAAGLAFLAFFAFLAFAAAGLAAGAAAAGLALPVAAISTGATAVWVSDFWAVALAGMAIAKATKMSGAKSFFT